MKNLFRNARVAVLSLVCVAFGLLLFAAFVISGTNHRLGSSGDLIGRFTVLSPTLIAIVLALASVIWNPRKTPGAIALFIAVVATLALYALGG